MASNIKTEVVRDPVPLAVQRSQGPADTTPKEERIGDWVCFVTKKDITESFDPSFNVDPSADVIWPGSVIYLSSIATGEYRAVRGKRAPLVLTSTLPVGKATTAPIEDPSLATVRDALNQLTAEKLTRSTKADFSYQFIEVHSEAHMSVAANIGFKGGGAKLKGLFDFSERSVTNKLLMRFQQTYYTVQAVVPDNDPGRLFVGEHPIDDDQAYVSSVTYGRLLMFAFESTESTKDMRAAVEASYSKMGIAEVSAGLSVEQKRVLGNTTMRVLVLGGAAEEGVKLITKGVSGINEVIASGANFGPTSPAHPMSYSLRFLSTGASAKVQSSTEYMERRCQRATGVVDVLVDRITCDNVDDSGGSHEEIYGKIRVRIHTGPDTKSVEEVVWEKGRRNWVSLGKNEWTEVGWSQRVRVDDAYKAEVKDSSFVEVIAELWEADRNDWINPDDRLWGRSKMRLLDPANPDGKFTLSDEGTRVSVTYRVSPVESA